MKPVVISESPIGMVELKKELELVKKRDGELNFRANKTEEYLNNFALLSIEQAEELKKKLEGLKIARLKPKHIIKIIDLLPVSVNDLKIVLQGYTLSLSQENMKTIVEAVKSYLPEK